LDTKSHQNAGFTDLKNLLDAVHLALRSANFSSLNELVIAQDRVISDLITSNNQTPLLKATEVFTLRRLADRNRRMLEATMRGIKSASRRRREVEEVSLSTQTYDRSGRRAALDPQNGAFEKRR